MSNVTKLSDAIKFALFVGAASSAASVTAVAQEKDEAKTLDRVEVTGSRIKRVDAETSQPVAVITRADIEKSGVTNVFDILNNITASDGSGLSTVTTQTNGSDGSQRISLRGLGSQRTLVLVDGKRWLQDVNGSVDLSTIPLAIIERIDILKDGASATYGSDAIAGVVNLITRKNYEGAQVGLQFGQYTPGDGSNMGFDATIGAAGERTSGVVSVSYSEQNDIFAADRLRATVPLWGNYFYGYTDAQGNPNDCGAILAGAADPFGLGGFCGSASGQYGLFTGQTGSGIGSQSLAIGANLVDGIQPGDYSTFTNNRRYNFAPINYIQQPAERYNIFASGRAQITDNISAFARASYTKRTSSQQLAEVPLTVANAGNNGPQWQFGMASDSIFNPWGVQSGLNGGAGWRIDALNYRMSPLGPRRYNEDRDAFAVQLGLEGSFEIGDRFFAWELQGQRNDQQSTTFGENFVNLFNLKNALGSSGYDAVSGEFFCGKTYATRILGCTPFFITGGPNLGLGANVVGNGNGTAIGGATRAVTQADIQKMLDYVGYSLVSTQGNTDIIYSGSLSGDLFELPGGMFGFAVGFEHRSQDGYSTPDSLISEGGSSTNFALPTKGGTEVTEYFLEVRAPLLKDVFLAKELELSAAVRKSDYSARGFGDADPTDADTTTELFITDPGSPTNKFFGLKWKPFNDLLVRASIGDSFRAPSAGDLFGGTGEGFPSVTDRCRAGVGTTASPRYDSASTTPAMKAACDAATGLTGVGTVQPFAQIRSLFGSSPLLQPEQGQNQTLGIVYSPSFADGLEVSLDYWKIELEDAISSFSPQFIVNRCYRSLDPSFCGFIVRDKFDAVTNPLGTGAITVINSIPFNAAGYRVKGIDGTLTYRFDGGDWGNFRFQLDTTKVLSNESKGLPDSDWFDVTGLYTGNPNPEYRSNLFVDWSKGDWSVSWTTRTMSNVYENCFTWCNDQGEGDGRNNTGFYAVHDINVRWKAPWDAVVSVGKRNAFDKEPPVLTNNTFAHSFDAAYDIPGGGYWYMQYRQDF